METGKRGRIDSFGQGLERQIVCRECKKLFALFLCKIIRFKMCKIIRFKTRSGITGKCVWRTGQLDFGEV